MRNRTTFFTLFFVIFMYTYLVGAETSMLMLYMLLVCVPVSFLMTWPFKKYIDMELDIPSCEVECGSIVRMNIKIRNKSFMPIPFLYIRLSEADNLSITEKSEIHLSFSPYETKTITVKYSADYRGIAEIGLKSMLLSDYLGLFSFSLLKGLDVHHFSGKVIVLPRISNMKPCNAILKTKAATNIMNDTGTMPDTFQSWSGEPGHEYRDYVPGDPLHRIHWKLSAKTRQLKVRKNEGSGVSKKSLILDPVMVRKSSEAAISRKPFTLYPESWERNKRFPFFSVKKNSPAQHEDALRRKIEDKTLEALLSVTNMVIQWGMLTEVWVYADGCWRYWTVSHKKEILDLQRHLADYRFLDSDAADLPERLPLSVMFINEKMNRNFMGREAIFFTGGYDPMLQKFLNGFNDRELSADLIVISGNDAAETYKSSIEKGILAVIQPDQDLSQVSI